MDRKEARAIKSKFETHVAPNTERICEWVKKGATAKEIAKKLGIAYSSLRKYIDLGHKGDERYKAFAAAFTCACDIPDDNVEASLYKRACGYQFIEVTVEEKIDRSNNVIKLTKKVVRDVPPDPTSAMFWLTNRRGDKWRYKPDSSDLQDSTGGVVIIPEVKKEAGDEL